MQFVSAALPLVFFGLPLVFGLLGFAQPFGAPGMAPALQWMLSLGLGVPSLWAAMGHAFASERVARSIGWSTSPFQKEVAGANLGIGLGAIAASGLGTAAAWAMFLVSAGFLWSAAAVHIADMRARGNFAINNAGPIFWWDILTPAAILVLLLRHAFG